jgi:hypothetical protein
MIILVTRALTRDLDYAGSREGQTVVAVYRLAQYNWSIVIPQIAIKQVTDTFILKGIKTL